MTDEQMAREFLIQVRDYCRRGVAMAVLTAIIGEARSTERARCAAIAQSYTDDAYLDPAQFVAREIQRVILRG